MKVKSESEVTQSCPTLCDPIDCSVPGSSVHGIFQARVLDWGASVFSMQYIEIELWYQIEYYTPVFLGFPGGSDGKEFTCNEGDLSLVPGLGRSPGDRHANSLQHSCRKNPHGQKSLAGCSTYMHTPHILYFLYLFIHQWTLRLIPYLDFAGNMAMHKGHRYVFEILIPFPSDIHPEVGLLGHMVGLF